MQAVFFDLDGTLLDTAPDIRAALNKALTACGHAPVDAAQTLSFVGNGARKLIERAAPEGDHEKLLALFKSYYAASEHLLTRPYAGMQALVADLKARGMKLAVVTNKLQRAADLLMERFFPGLFDFVGGDDGSFPCKPDPTLARYAALSLRVPVGECVFVGDGETDVQTAKNAGMDAISALWGYRPRALLEEYGGRCFAADAEELRALLEVRMGALRPPKNF